ncbi:MAG: homocysteine S-methyltransferase family protein [Deltaproteobacteria bacterium]|nr:homocysteine S-methyltransferase family protein [Deltaproteobacteria bacterium]
MSAFLDRVTSGATPLLLDGGLGSMLIAEGLESGAAPEAWNVSHPERVTRVHRAYVAAGSDAVQTNTFGGNALRLARFELGASLAELNRRAVELARAAGPRFVVADVGPSGEYRPPVGHADPAAWRAAFAEQARALASPGPDAFHLETMSDLVEARTALEAVLEQAPGVPVMVSMTFERRKRGFYTIMGDPLAASLRALADAGAAVVGANCTLTSPDMRALAEEALAAATVPLVFQPNAGLPRLEGTHVHYDQSPEAFAEDLAHIAALGARVLGGCCGTGPAHIAALAARLRGGTSA